LHRRPDHVGGRAARRAVRHDRRRRARGDERQHLPLRRLPEHRRRHPAGALGALRPEEAVVNPFSYLQAADADSAIAAAAQPGAIYIAGGTTLVDLMKLHVQQPVQVVDITALPLDAVEVRPDGVRIGALARNADVAFDPTIRARYPVLAEALLA